MKQRFRRVAALLLSAALLCGSALGSNALGDELHGYSTPLAEGATLRTQLFWSASKSDLRQENYITYQPNSSISPKVAYGSSVLSTNTVATMATQLESQGKRVLSGMNGDYFVMGAGDPLGIVITDGILRSSASSFDAVGFYPDGSAFIGKPQLSVTANISGMDLKVESVNKVRTSTGFHLLTSDFAANTQNTEPGFDVILAPVADGLGTTVTNAAGQSLVQNNVLKIGGRVSCVVESVQDNSAPIAIPAGKFVLTVNKSAGEFLVSTLSTLQPGAPITIDITSPDERWSKADSAIGGFARVLTNSSVNSSVSDGSNNAPRTGVGVKADGSVVFYTIDGRQSGLSIGASMTQVGTRLAELGCIDAVCLDGGGSTTFGVTMPDSNGFTVTNSPSEGTQRKVTNALFLVSNLPPSGTPARLHVEPKSRTLLAGSSTTMSHAFVDSNWHPTTASGESLTWSAAQGTISADGVYTAPAVAGEDTITATSASGFTGSTTVTVFPAPDTLKFLNENGSKTLTSLSLSEGQSVNLTTAVSYRTIPLTAQDTAYQWSVSPASLGTITPDGQFTASSTGGTGSITVTLGSFSKSLPLSISAQGNVTELDNFEFDDPLYTPSPDVTLSLNQRDADGFLPAMLRFGSQSLRVDYDLSSGSTARLDSSFSLNNTPSYLSIWVYGDKTGNSLNAIVRDANGQESTVSFGNLDFSGWKRLTLALPQGTTHLAALTLTGSSKGSIWLDQLCSSNQQSADSTAPQVNLSVAGTQLSAKVSDNNMTPLSEANLSFTVDGEPLSFTFDATTSTLIGTLPSDGALHRASVTVTDASGNLARASQRVGSSNSNAGFADMTKHWSKDDTSYLAAQGIVKGEETKNGTYFYPDRSITRGDFALMIARFLDLDMTLASGETLPFRDASKIPSWSKGAVNALYKRGIMQGSSASDGVYAKATSPITRAEAMTILARIQPKGFPSASLSAFTDAGSIPSWSKEHVAVLVGQEVVSGANGLLRPNDSVSRAELCKMLSALR